MKRGRRRRTGAFVAILTCVVGFVCAAAATGAGAAAPDTRPALPDTAAARAIQARSAHDLGVNASADNPNAGGGIGASNGSGGTAGGGSGASGGSSGSTGNLGGSSGGSTATISPDSTPTSQPDVTTPAASDPATTPASDPTVPATGGASDSPSGSVPPVSIATPASVFAPRPLAPDASTAALGGAAASSAANGRTEAAGANAAAVPADPKAHGEAGPAGPVANNAATTRSHSVERPLADEDVVVHTLDAPSRLRGSLTGDSTPAPWSMLWSSPQGYAAWITLLLVALILRGMAAGMWRDSLGRVTAGGAAPVRSRRRRAAAPRH